MDDIATVEFLRDRMKNAMSNDAFFASMKRLCARKKNAPQRGAFFHAR